MPERRMERLEKLSFGATVCSFRRPRGLEIGTVQERVSTRLPGTNNSVAMDADVGPKVIHVPHDYGTKDGEIGATRVD